MLSKSDMFDQAVSVPDMLNRGGLSVGLIEARTRYVFRVKPGDVTAVKKLTGLKFPRKIGQTAITQAQIEACLGPDEWLWLAPPAAAAKMEKTWARLSQTYVCSGVDISHRNVGFEISGPASERLLSAGCPLDLSSQSFPKGRACRTVFESVSIVLIRTGDNSFHLECWRSFAPYLRDYFSRIVSTRGV